MMPAPAIFPFVVHWGDGSHTRFEDQREYEVGIIRCQHEFVQVQVPSLFLGIIGACWKCLTLPMWERPNG